ncbi:hypothetical protein PRIPAC_90606 [Pristionchus pacificus]|uniref:G protein-coupled receptor n=1 Tax=Pristionchus pacificus TaxID=54126 RepID=A0A2A6CYL3_PRIPA|nr:hypothetical protein PRIPAC_90606 [Pristionchus pacificus]|eukprot:PDM83302.1 G protein-coupled receptor [Pristionchus pacificus]
MILRWYGSIHRYLSVFICSFGILANMVHIVILTRHVMKRSTVNRLLAFIACCDIVKMFTYLIYMIRFNLMAVAVYEEEKVRVFSFPWIVFLFMHIMLSIDLHTTSLYLSVCTAFIRYQAIKQLQSKFMQPQIALKLFIAVAAAVSFFCIPTFLVHKVQTYDVDGTAFYSVTLPRNDASSCRMFMLNLWLTGIVFKAVPCALLVTFTILLLYNLHHNQRKHEKIVSKDAAITRAARSDRTTLLLVLLLFVFIITEMPQGIIAILNGIYPTEVHHFLYTPLGEMLDLLSLINGNACFILYPCISSQYRESFRMMVARLRQAVDSYSPRPTSRASSHKTVKYSAVEYKSHTAVVESNRSSPGSPVEPVDL